ncbi:hypothetical protein F5884DRAFT_863329 [Xylogone sp. PMI_703]|nr:hypothetical protein F5884DRAFT_863329 [Xylogone sp. PMI_703]
MAKIVVITGANRGIGLELARASTAQGHSVIAVIRNPDEATTLKSFPNILGVVKGDMGDLASLPRVAEDVAKLAPEGIDELWNNAGVMISQGPIDTVDPFNYQKELTVNVISPSALTSYLLPLLRKRQTKRVIFMSSGMGSMALAENFVRQTLRGENPPIMENFIELMPYCVGKSGLTMEALGWHAILYPEGFTVVAIHPGWVQTDMTGGPGRAHLTTEESVTTLLDTMDNKIKPKPEFVLYNYDGSTIPW